MNTQKFEINDPRLTAYALGELEGAEAEAIRARVEADPEAQAFVTETRALAGVLEGELARETQPRLVPEQREKLLGNTPKKRAPWAFWTAGGLGLVAASVVAVLLLPNGLTLRKRPTAFRQAVEESVKDYGAPMPAKKGDSQRTKERAYAPPASAPAEALFQADMAVDAPMSAGKGSYGSAGAGGSMARAKRMAVPGGPSAGIGALHEGSYSFEAEQQVADGKWNTETYQHRDENGWKKVALEPLSTFSADVDTASYSNVRRFLEQGTLPPKDAVRIEELVNYFPYDYAPPTDGKPFAVHVEMAETPWSNGHQLVRVALKGKELAAKERPVLNLVYLVDISGSMNEPHKLPLVRESLKLLVDQLQAKDHVAIVVYANGTGVALEPTSGESKQKIKEAIDNLRAGGGTNGAGGIELAYQTVQKNFVKGGMNRVVLCTDGDFNLGQTSEGDLVRLIEEKAKGGAFLTVLGFGMGNYKDSMLQKLSDKGNGNYAYIDTAAEARKALVEQALGTLVTIAKDVKIQVEFNPAYVGSYRLLGYEKRLLNQEDFNDDKKDAGEIGAGHTVTAFYEITPPSEDPAGKSVDPLKYGEKRDTKGKENGEALTVKLRYKEPDGSVSKLLEVPVKHSPQEFAKASGDFKFAAAVAAFGMLLRDSEHKGASSFEAVALTAEKQKQLKGKESSYRAELVELVRKAGRLKGPATAPEGAATPR